MFTTRPTLQGTFGMVSSTHWLASQSAMAVLEDGGNAYDAAVAAGFVLHVVEPHLNGPGGEVPIILAPAGGEVQVLCGQGPAPAGATIEHYRSLGLELVPGTGPLAAAVPGAFDAWMVLLRDHGTKSLMEVLRYAIGYAEDGHAPVERVGQTVESVRELFETEWTSSADVYLPGGRSPASGELFRNPALAATWRRLTAEAEQAGGGDRVAQIEAARSIWRDGFIAEALIRQSGRPTLDTSGSHHTGTLTATDLAGWSATYEAPATYDWNGWTLCKAAGWSQGPRLPPATRPAAARARASGVRLRGIRPPPYGGLQAGHGRPRGLVRRRRRRTARHAPLGAVQHRPPRPGRRPGLLRTAPRQPRRTRARPQRPRHRRRGRGVRLRRPRRPGGGRGRADRRPRRRDPRRHLPPRCRGPLGQHDRRDTERRLAPVQSRRARTRLPARHPPPDGLAGARTAQLLTPGRRPRTTLTPSLALRDGTPVLAFGTPGGDQQDQWQLHFFLAVALRPHVRGGLDLQGAIDAPNWHNDSFPSSFYPRGMRPGSVTVEPSMDAAVVEGLRGRGHDVTVGEPWSEGRLCAVARDPRTGILSAAANPRGMQGYAVGR